MTQLTGHSHGGEVYALAKRMRTAPDNLLDFSSNANIFAYNLTAELVAQHPYPFLHYPDSSAQELTEALARHEGLEPERILAGNGGAELIWLALRALAPRKVLFIGPVFSEYVRALQSLGIPYDILTPSPENDFICSGEDLNALWETDADLAILCTPNNPAGATYPNMPSLLHMLRVPRVLIDSSYREFLFGTEAYAQSSHLSYLEMIREGVTLFTLHSFTKFFCCPGIRLGYLVGEKNVLTRMQAMRPAWMVSPFAQQMGILFLENIARYRETLGALTEAVADMGRELRRLDLMRPDKVFEGVSFLCCGLAPRFNAPGVAKSLQNRLVLVRECDSIPGMPSGYIRVQARPEADAARLLEALETVYIENM